MPVDVAVVIKAAKAGGAIIKQYFGQALEVEEKSMASDFRTKADTESETAILAILRKAYPDINIYAEESGRVDRGSDLTFVIDPLDGSNNFSLGVPTFTVSIALMRGEETILGVVYNPILEHAYWAEKDKGAFLDDEPLHTSQEADIKRATIAYTKGYDTPPAVMLAAMGKLHKIGVKRIVDHWSPAHDYCLLASGRIEGIINDRNDLYDFAAGKLIVREAGGIITGYKGEAVPDTADICLLSNGTALHQVLLSAV